MTDCFQLKYNFFIQFSSKF